jgi:hypothetical protein
VPPASPVDRHARRACRARARVARVVLVTPALAFAALLAACSLDWSVRSPDGGDAALSEGSATADATDAPVDGDAADGSVPTDAPISAEAAACATSMDSVTAKRKKARECQIGTMGQCTTTVNDECGCKVIVTFAGTPDTMAYTKAIGDLVAQCGKPPCTAACPQLGLSTGWACLGSGAGFSCSP